MSNFARIDMPVNASTEKPADQKPADQKPADQQTPQTPPTDQTPQRPDWVPEKFWKDGKVDQEGLAKSYAELEKKVSTPPADQKPKDGEKPTTNPTGEAAFDPFFKEFEAEGKLSDKSYESLQKLGLPKAVVDQYIAGVQASQAATEARIFETVGGKDNYTKIASWARENLSAAEIEAYNKAVGGSAEEASLAVSGLAAKFAKAEGQPAKLYGGKGTEPATGGAFKSWAQVTEAMNDPRYKNDPAYRDGVAQRLATSDL